MPAIVHLGPTGRSDIDAPERLWWRIEGQQDRGPDHRRVGHRDGAGRAGGQRFEPTGNPVHQIDDRFPAVRRTGRIGEPHRKVCRKHTAEHVAAPPAAVQIGKARLDRGAQSEQLGSLQTPKLATRQRCEFRCAEVDCKRKLTPANSTEGFVRRKPSGRHRVGHRVRHQRQPDDLTHAMPIECLSGADALLSLLGPAARVQQTRDQHCEHDTDRRPQHELCPNGIQPEVIQVVGGESRVDDRA
jgi:hypothetical protein